MSIAKILWPVAVANWRLDAPLAAARVHKDAKFKFELDISASLNWLIHR